MLFILVQSIHNMSTRKIWTVARVRWLLINERILEVVGLFKSYDFHGNPINLRRRRKPGERGRKKNSGDRNGGGGVQRFCLFPLSCLGPQRLLWSSAVRYTQDDALLLAMSALWLMKFGQEVETALQSTFTDNWNIISYGLFRHYESVQCKSQTADFSLRRRGAKWVGVG